MDANGWTEIACGSNDRKSIQLVVTQVLEEAGIPVKRETIVPACARSSSKYFGVSIYSAQETSSYAIGDSTFQLPKVFAQSVQYLESNTKCEGLFRKAGSVSRQKTLRASLESGGSLLEANPHDVAGLLKQYIRELPEPLTTRLLSPTFEKCQHLSNSSDYYTLLACLLLPEENLRMLKVLMRLLAMVADDYKHSLMSCASLAIVMAPNFTESLQPARRGGGRGGETNLKEYTAVLEALILNAGLIGLIPKSVLSKAVTGQRPDECGNRGNISGNVLSPRYQKKKRRSASFSGIVEGLSHRLKGKAFDTQTDESSCGTLKRKVACEDVDVPVPKKPAHLPTGRVQVKGQRMSFLNKFRPSRTDKGSATGEATPPAAHVPPPPHEDHLPHPIGPDNRTYVPGPGGKSPSPLSERKSHTHSHLHAMTVPPSRVPTTPEQFVPLVVEFPLAPDPGISDDVLTQTSRRLSVLTAAERRRSGAKGLEKPMMDAAFRMSADSPLLLPPSQLRASLSYPDLTPSSRRCCAPAPPPSETTPYKCGLKHSASVDSGSVKRPSGMGMGRGPTAPTARLAIRDVCQQKLLPAGTTATLQHTTARQCRKVSLEGEGDGPGDLSTLPHSPEMLERIGEEMRERQQCYLYDSSYSNGIQKMNTSYCHAVSNRSSSSSSSFGAHGDRRLPSTPSHFGGTPLGGVFKMADRLMTPGSLLRCKRKPDGQPFLSALTPSWKRARKEGHRDGEEEMEKLSKRAQLYLVQERTADEGVGKENVSSEPIASPVTAQASNKGPHVREWIV
eukprot:Em0014g805a